MTEPKFTPGPWEIDDRGYGFAIDPSVCWIGENSSTTPEQLKANANRLALLPELYDALVPHLSATCIRCRRRECDFDFETFVQNEGCGCCDGGIFREHWKLLKKVRDGE